ncbi:MAG: hypothetical protein H7263_04245 [Candidatus Sericytochromatia bacterium]|nr:hypothetical protein [Candidatus Sericytochromatia bacterium]
MKITLKLLSNIQAKNILFDTYKIAMKNKYSYALYRIEDYEHSNNLINNLKPE